MALFKLRFSSLWQALCVTVGCFAVLVSTLSVFGPEYSTLYRPGLLVFCITYFMNTLVFFLVGFLIFVTYLNLRMLVIGRATRNIGELVIGFVGVMAAFILMDVLTYDVLGSVQSTWQPSWQFLPFSYVIAIIGLTGIVGLPHFAIMVLINILALVRYTVQHRLIPRYAKA